MGTVFWVVVVVVIALVLISRIGTSMPRPPRT